MLTQVWHFPCSLAGVERVLISLEIAVIETFAMAQTAVVLVEGDRRCEDEIQKRVVILTF